MALVTDRILIAGQIRNAEWGLINNDIVSNEELIETAAGAVARTVLWSDPAITVLMRWLQHGCLPIKDTRLMCGRNLCLSMHCLRRE